MTANDVPPSSLPYVPGPAVRAALTPTQAVNALEAALRSGVDPEHDAPRTRLDTAHGQLLQMPSTAGTDTGTKLLTVSPDNPARDRPLIQGVYVLFGGEEQSPRAVIDGPELTNLRTAAVSALGVRLMGTTAPRHLAVFGTGVQAWEHAVAFADVFTLERITVAGRNRLKAEAMAARIERELGVDADTGGAEAAAEGDAVVCATSATRPFFDGDLVRDDAVVVAMGAHTPDARELDDVLMGRGFVAVESRDSALREAGDVLLAIEAGALRGIGDVATLAELAAGTAKRPTGRPGVFVTTGMPWQDLAVAVAVAERAGA